MSTARYIVGDSLTVLRSMPDASADLVLTSPPFLALRSYLPPDHPDKALEMGSEATPGEFVDALLDIAEECRRVLAPHGSLCFELGDTFAGSGGAGGDYGTSDPGATAMREGQPKFDGSALRNRRTRNANRPSGESQTWRTQDGTGRRQRGADVAAGILAPTRRPGPAGRDAMTGWPLDKCLALIPESFRWALAYGRNPFTGRETEPWRVRNVIRWCRPNPPVGALGDKFRPATSEMVVACVSRSRFFDLDAVRTPFTGHAGTGTGIRKGQDGAQNHDNRPDDLPTRRNTHEGAPPLDWWEISTEPYKGSHYATWPTALLTRPIKAMCPERVCRTCGEPSRRIVEVELLADGKPSDGTLNGRSAIERGREESATHKVGRATFSRSATTTGWTDCGHDDWRAGVVLDPFAGSGATLAVATGHGRDAIGIDLDERNAELARQRVGMFLTVEGDEPAPAVTDVQTGAAL